MRHAFAVLMVVSGVSMVPGCASDTASAPTAPMDTKKYTMKSDGLDVLAVTVGEGVSCKAEDGLLHFKGKAGDFEIWAVKGAASIDQGVASVPGTIASEFKGFKTTTTSDQTIAGGPAKRLAGTGTEADDGDPGSADVVIFKVGSAVFAACNHGESLSSSTQRWMLDVLGTARKP